MSNDKASPPKNFRSNWSIEKLNKTNFQVIGIVIRCVLKQMLTEWNKFERNDKNFIKDDKRINAKFSSKNIVFTLYGL